MDTSAIKQQQKMKRREQIISPIYSRSLLTRSVMLPITSIGKNINETIQTYISANFEGKCIAEGYVKQNSSKIVTISSGIVERGNQILFTAVFECDVCFPVEGSLIQCIAKNITNAGVRGISVDDFPSPVDVFLARDHHYVSSEINEIKEGDKFLARVIGQRFELNDRQVSVIAEIVKPRDKEFVKPPAKEVAKPRIVIQDE
jgi:DNA-directed RNA polymerase subunit E'/Rpb7